jgi:hypothetical protein
MNTLNRKGLGREGFLKPDFLELGSSSERPLRAPFLLSISIFGHKHGFYKSKCVNWIMI